MALGGRLNVAPRKFTVWTFGQHFPAWEQGFPRPLIDLASVQAIDAYAVALLVLYARRCTEAGGRARILLPEREDVLHRLAGMGLFRLVGEEVWTDRPPPEDKPKEGFSGGLLQVEEEKEIESLVERVCNVLEDRFPLGEQSIDVLAMAMIELLQNILHHANPLGEDMDPYGLSAVEEYSDHIHLVVMDKGVGLRRSLALNPRYRELNVAQALEAVLVEGASRFEGPGRGGALRRIREVIQANEGRLFVRSGSAGFWQAEVEWSVGRVHPFPGVQVSIQLPRALFFG
jgi:anti-sigma regulatory factor (Ser/Thr protein kinase)/ABC-type transporter Mla MlaB component